MYSASLQNFTSLKTVLKNNKYPWVQGLGEKVIQYYFAERRHLFTEQDIVLSDLLIV